MYALPGAVLVTLWLTSALFFAALWLLGLPAWAMLCLNWASPLRRRVSKLVLFPLGLVAAGIVFALSGSLLAPIIAPALYLLLPALVVRFMVRPDRPRWSKLGVEGLLAVLLILAATFLPTGDWSSATAYAGGALVTGIFLAVWAGRDSTSFRQRAKTSAPTPT